MKPDPDNGEPSQFQAFAARFRRSFWLRAALMGAFWFAGMAVSLQIMSPHKLSPFADPVTFLGWAASAAMFGITMSMVFRSLFRQPN